MYYPLAVLTGLYESQKKRFHPNPKQPVPNHHESETAQRTGQRYSPIHELTAAAFGREVEAVLVDLARERGEITWSIFAEDEANETVGHVMISPMTLAPDAAKRHLAIGPVSVKPELQTMGIGTALILMMEAIHRGRGDGYDAILLLGNPRYYERFGFVTAPVGNEYGTAMEFMALELREGSLEGAEKSVARYVSAFADAERTASD